MAKDKPSDAELNRKVRLYLLLNIVLVITAVFLFDLLGVLNFRALFMPLLSRVPGVGRVVQKNVEDPGLLHREERKKEEYSLSVWEDKLRERQKAITEREEELKSLDESLAAEREEIALMVREFEKSRDEYADYKKNVVQQAIYIESMPPKASVARLQEMDDLTVMDIFREMERRAQTEGRTSIVSYLLSLFDAKRASVIQRKMLRLEQDE